MATTKNLRSGGIDRSRIADQIFEELRDDIVLGKIVRGEKLPSERELANQYGVSGPTVREAIRGLTLLGLVDVKHGSGAFVTANSEPLIARSLGAVIQLGNLGVVEVLGVLGALNEHAAGLAAVSATREDHARLEAALVILDQATTAETAAEAAREFHGAVAASAHNPLLAALCGFLTNVQIELGAEFIGTSTERWKKVFAKLRPMRAALIDAIIRRDRDAALGLAREFHAKSVQLLTSMPKAKEVRLADPKLRQLLSSMIGRVK